MLPEIIAELIINETTKWWINSKLEDVDTLFSKENINIIDNIFKLEFEKQEKNIANLISANIKITIKVTMK